ncbi:hypothetical protein CFR74_04400 [Novacetimonas hansenii]|nr:hypothetical protein CFR74_04400 [Novacetimonas hansenii]
MTPFQKGFLGMGNARTDISRQRLLHKTVLGAVWKQATDKKNSFWGLTFDRKMRRLSKLFGKSFTKNFYDFMILADLPSQTLS